MKNGAAVGCSRSNNAEMLRLRFWGFGKVKPGGARGVFKSQLKSRNRKNFVSRISKKTSVVWVYKEHSVTLLQKTWINKAATPESEEKTFK